MRILQFYILLIGFALLLLFSVPLQASEIKIRKPVSYDVPNFCGDKQYQSIKLKTQKPVVVQVTDEKGTPVGNIPVYFEFGNIPGKSENQLIYSPVCYTDSLGYAKTYVRMGTEQGEYEVLAMVKSDIGNSVLVYNLFARKSDWVWMLVIGLLGGLGLFLLGMNMLSEGMQRSAGDKMRTILGKLTSNRFLGVIIGTFVTVVVQSSSATTVMLVGFVQSRLMKFSQTIGVILGAAIGTTITVQLIAFKLTDYSLLMVALGFGLQLTSKSEKIKYIGQSVLGFGILFFGMYVMSESMSPLRSYDPFVELLLHLENPLVGIIVGAMFTALIQSSAAFIGIMIILASQGLLSLEASIPLVFGANIGTAITAILASIGTSRDAKKVALAHTLVKVLGVLIFIWWIPYLADLITVISPDSAVSNDHYLALGETVPRQIANTHTVFNIALTLLLLPFTGLVTRLIDKLLPSKKVEEQFKLQYLNRAMLQTPALALNLSKQEVIRMGHIVQDMLNDILLPYFTKEKYMMKEIAARENQVDFLRDEIKSYLIKTSRENIPQEQVNEAFQIMYTIKEFEQIADIISLNLYKKAEEWMESNDEFSDQGKKELMEYHLRTQKQISRAIEVFRDLNLDKAQAMKLKYKKYRTMAYDFEKSHYERLKEDVAKSVGSSKMHLELISNFREISSHATNIARILIDWSENGEEPSIKQEKKRKEE